MTKKTALKARKSNTDAREELTNIKYTRKQAIKALREAQPLESKKLADGYKWVTNGKVCKLVHPDNIRKNLANGFRVINQNDTTDV